MQGGKPLASPAALQAAQHSLKSLKLSFLGLGMMAQHFLKPLLDDNLVTPENVIGTQYTDEYVKTVQRDFPSITVTKDNRMAAREADIILLGFKPNDLESISQEIDGGLKKDAVVISMLAAVPTNRLAHSLQHKAVCRCMPNTPVKIRQGFIPYYVTPDVGTENALVCDRLFSALGESMLLPKEHHLDISTAISGSSPAYFFLIMEALTDAGVHCGLPRRSAEIMAMRSMQGSVNFALSQHGKANFAELKAAVTSPGGTTASALHQAEKHGLRHTISEIVWACYRRSLEIATQKNKVYGPGHWEPQNTTE